MKRSTWDTIQAKLEEFDLPPYLENTLRWVERHPRTVMAGALVLLMAAALTQVPGEPPVEKDAYNDEVPLFV